MKGIVLIDLEKFLEEFPGQKVSVKTSPGKNGAVADETVWLFKFPADDKYPDEYLVGFKRFKENKFLNISVTLYVPWEQISREDVLSMGDKLRGSISASDEEGNFDVFDTVVIDALSVKTLNWFVDAIVTYAGELYLKIKAKAEEAQ